MPRRVLACFLLFAPLTIAQSQSLTVQQLVDFVRSQQKLIKQKKSSDQETAKALTGYRLSEKLDIAVIEDLQSEGAGPLTVRALQKLQEQSKSLKAAVVQQVLPDDPIPIPTSVEQGQILDDVRDYVRNYDNEMTDFICTEVERRMRAPKMISRSSGEPSYQQVDDILSRITYYKHVETKTPMMQNNRPVHGDYKNLGGATSQGDFESMLQSVFDPSSAARFEWEKWTMLRTRLTMVFSFHVARDHSHWKLEVPNSVWTMFTAYSGRIYVDRDEPHAVTRVFMQAEEIPPDFPIQKASTTLDYQRTDISGQSFLLPYNEDLEMENAGILTKNSNSFQNYRKYEVGSEINYDIPANLSPVPDSSLKESPVKPPAPDCKDPKNKDLPACKR